MLADTANPFHSEADCDEWCRGCAECYRATGETVCGRACQHWRENSPRDLDQINDDDARAGAERDGVTW